MQYQAWNNSLVGTPWGNLTVELPSYDFQQQICWDLLQSWGNLEDPIPVIDPSEELDDEYENMPGLTSVEEHWMTFSPVEEFPAVAEPLEVAPEEDPMDPSPIMETAADVSTTSPRKENP